MRISTLIVTALAATAMAGAAFAQPPAGGGGPGGGGGRGPQMTPEQREAAFTAADANKDGKLDKAEFAKTLNEQQAAQADMRFMRQDTNMDGSISKEEWMNPPARGGRGGPPPAG